MDGFITRRPQRSLLNERSWEKTDTTIGHMRTDERENIEVHTGDTDEKVELDSGHKGKDIRENISESLQAIDADASGDKKQKKKKKDKRKTAKKVGIIFGIIVALLLAFLLYKAWEFGNRIFQGDILGIFQQKELKMDKYGRSNVLILGSTDDIAGRDGASLTDSMMVISVDQKKKNAYIYSIPRDLYVQYGRACAPGYEGKINAFYTCANTGKSREAEVDRMNATRKLIGNIFDMDIQYVAHVNTVVIRDAVNAVGGVTVNVKSEDPRGVLDATFDDLCREYPKSCKDGHYLNFSNGPNKMNGLQAMAFSQARGHTAPTYGLEKSNFDREKNQQLVLTALKDKATSTGTLTDIPKVVALMDAMGDNLRTNIDSKEVQTIMRLAADMEDKDIHRLTFVDKKNPLMTTGDIAGQSIVQPVAGLYDYSQIRAYLRKTIYATPVTREAAKVAVFNASGTDGLARKESDKLSELGMNITLVDNAPEGKYGKYKIYQLVDDGKKDATKSKLEELYSTKVTKGKPSFSIAAQADFVVVVGSAE